MDIFVNVVSQFIMENVVKSVVEFSQGEMSKNMKRYSEVLNVGVVGLGQMGKNHVRVLSQIGVLNVVYDISQHLTQKVAEQYNVIPATSMDELIELSDAVFVVTPTSTHFDLAKQVLMQNKHVFIEKPITLTVEEARELILLAQKNKRILQIGHIERFNPVVMELKKIIQNDKVISVDIKRLSSYDDRIKDTDVIFDLMIHDIDLLCYLFNEEIQIKGVLKKSIHRPELADHVSVLAETLSGIMITVTSSRVTEEKIRSISITTLRSYIHADYLTRNIYIHRRTNLQTQFEEATYRQENIVEKVYVPNYEPLYLQNYHFVEAIISESDPIVSGWDGLRAIQLAQQIQDYS
ncbi:Gfo/Idh/MocA family oxidoreductase [Caldibacillus thermoamylovorans]